MNEVLYTNLNLGKDTANALSICFFHATKLMCIFAQSFENIKEKKAAEARKTLKHRPETLNFDK